MFFFFCLVGWISITIVLFVVSWLDQAAQHPALEQASSNHQAQYQATIRQMDKALAPMLEQNAQNRDNEQRLAKLRADGCPVVRLMYPSDGLLRRIVGPSYINRCVSCGNEFDAGGWPRLTQCAACSASWWQRLNSR